MDIIGLHFKDADFIGQVLSNGMTKMKLAILAILYCGEFVKNSTVLIETSDITRMILISRDLSADNQHSIINLHCRAFVSTHPQTC